MKKTIETNRLAELIGSIGSWLIPIIVYIATIAPCVTAGDAGEFVVATHRFGMPHPPGYPLYMLLLKIWSALPFSLGPDPLAVKCNLFSAAAMAAACGVFYRLMRTLTGSAPASLAAALTFAFSATAWKFAVVTEVYALHILLVTLILAGLVIAREAKKSVGLVITALAFGFGLAHHPTILLMLPMMIFLWPKAKTFTKRIPTAGIIAGFILPLVFYLFLPLFASHTPGYAEKGFTAGNFIDTITRAEYRERPNWQELPPDQLVRPKDVIGRVINYLPKQAGWFVLALSVLGWFFAPLGKRVYAFWSAVSALIWIFAVTFLSRGSPLGMPFSYLRSVDEFLVPVNLFLAIGLGFILSVIGGKLIASKDIAGTEGQNIIPLELASLSVFIPLILIPFYVGFFHSAPYSNMTHHTFAQDLARNVLGQVPENGVLIVSGDESFMFEYLQEVRGIRQDVEMKVYPFSYVTENAMLSKIDSLAYYLTYELGDRDCMFTFGDAAQAVEILRPYKGLRLDGVAFTLIDRDEDDPSFTIGDPNIWTSYQLRNLDMETLYGAQEMSLHDIDFSKLRIKLVPDDFEYEVFDRYSNGLKAAVSWMNDNGWDFDPSIPWLDKYIEMLEAARDHADYPAPPGAPVFEPAS